MDTRFHRPELMGKALLAATRDPNMGAGILCSGASGSGKTNIAEWVFTEYVKRGWPALWFCPHGDSAKSLRRQILMLPKRMRNNILYVRATDTKRILSLRPLHVPRHGLSEYEFRARLANRVGHMRHLLLSSVGEGGQGVIGKPLLRKWTTVLLTIGAMSGLNVADLVHLLDVSSPVFQLLSTLCPDVVSRAQLNELPEMRPIDREHEISSTRSRLVALLENVVVQMILGRNDDGVLDMNTVIDSGKSIIFDLATDGMLSREDQPMIANLYLSEFLNAVKERPQEKRRDYLCVLDELPVFDLSAPLINDLLTEIRKFRTKFWLSFQGASRFPGRHDNEFLNNIVSQCRLHVYLAHGASDAKFFAQEYALSTYDPTRVKHEQQTPQQVLDHHEIATLVDHGENEREQSTVGDSTNTSDSWQDSSTQQQGSSSSVRNQFDVLHDIVTDAQSSSASTSQNVGGSRGNTRSNSTSIGRGRSTTYKQTLVPVYRTEMVTTGFQFFTPEEWHLMAAAKLTRFNPGECALSIRGKGVCFGKLPLVIDRLARTPKSARRRITDHDRLLQGLDWYASPEEIVARRSKFMRELLHQLRLVANGPHRTSSQGLSPQIESPLQQGLLLPPPAQLDLTPHEDEFELEEPADDAPWEI